MRSSIKYYFNIAAVVFRDSVSLWIKIGGPDLAASLAYFTLLSFIPFLSVLILVASSFMDEGTLNKYLMFMVEAYFPVSREFLGSLISPLIDDRPIASVISGIAILWGATGLIRATHRAVNRIFGNRRSPFVKLAIKELIFFGFVAAIFLSSIALSGLMRASLEITEDLSKSSRLLEEVGSTTFRLLSTVVGPITTLVVFTWVYRVVPNILVPWKMAAVGAVVATILFEVAKYISFWVVSVLGSQGTVYGPISSVVIFLMWSQTAAMIFLLGASMTNVLTGKSLLKVNQRAKGIG